MGTVTAIGISLLFIPSVIIMYLRKRSLRKFKEEMDAKLKKAGM